MERGDSDELPHPTTAPGGDIYDLIHNLDAIVWEADAETWQTTFVSRRAEDLLGYPGEQWLADPDFWLERLVHPDDRGWLVEACRSMIEEGKEDRLEYRAVAADGRVVWLRDTMSVFRNVEGRRQIRGVAFDITEQKRAEEALRESEERYRLVTRATNDLVYDWNISTGELSWAGAAAAFGYRPEDMKPELGWWEKRLHPHDHDEIMTDLSRLLEQGGEFWSSEYRFLRGDGSYAPIFDRGYIVRDAEGEPVRMIGSVMDLTERRHMEEQLRQAQRMEAVGKLAGGVAHDFNNLLTAIRGHAEFILADLSASDPLRQDAEEIANAANRARDLTRQLLAFGRKQILQPRAMELNAAIAGLEPMLRRLLPADVALSVSLAPEVGAIEADPIQLEQVAVNLVVNARDAMSEGGRLAIETSVAARGAETDGLDLPPGRYAVLTVSDTGTGIPIAVLKRIFEPFFTTKEVGKGMGLGLATVHGIVKQSGGDVVVESEVGHGSTFRVYLPAAGPAPAPETGAEEKVGHTAGAETVLVVEDEAAVRSLVRRVLQRSGYAVLEAADGRDALRMLEDRIGSLGLVVTDVVMPGMDGRLVERLRSERPDLPVIYMSGYTEDDVLRIRPPRLSERVVSIPEAALFFFAREASSAPPSTPQTVIGARIAMLRL